MAVVLWLSCRKCGRSKPEDCFGVIRRRHASRTTQNPNGEYGRAATCYSCSEQSVVELAALRRLFNIPYAQSPSLAAAWRWLTDRGITTG